MTAVHIQAMGGRVQRTSWLSLLHPRRQTALAIALVAFGCGGSVEQVAAEDALQGDVDGGASSVAHLSASKLGFQLLASAKDPAADAVLAACPRILKWVLPVANARASIDAYKTRCSGGVVVIRVFVPRTVSYVSWADANAAADDFWKRIEPQLADLDPGQIDWLEGPNELDNLPNWCVQPESSAWFGAFWSHLADRINSAGYHPLVGSIGPRCAAQSPMTIIEAFTPTATAMKLKPYRWGWGYHSYSTTLSQSVEIETYPLGYRAIRNGCGLAGKPIVISEGGALVRTNEGPLGWQAGAITGPEYVAWLKWFDARLNEDPAVVGVTLYQVGNHGTYGTYELSPIVPELASYLRGSSH